MSIENGSFNSASCDVPQVLDAVSFFHDFSGLECIKFVVFNVIDLKFKPPF